MKPPPLEARPTPSERILSYLVEQPAHRWIALDVIARLAIWPGVSMERATDTVLEHLGNLQTAGLVARRGTRLSTEYQATGRARQHHRQAEAIRAKGAPPPSPALLQALLDVGAPPQTNNEEVEIARRRAAQDRLTQLERAEAGVPQAMARALTDRGDNASYERRIIAQQEAGLREMARAHLALESAPPPSPATSIRCKHDYTRPIDDPCAICQEEARLDRRAQLLAELHAFEAVAPDDELELLVELAHRIESGRKVYGAWSATEDPRDLAQEAHEEHLDGIVYSSMRIVKARREGGGTR